MLLAGDPHPEVTVPLLHQMVEAGVDIVELGLPFSDPMADGPVIALAAERALAAGTNTLDALNMVKESRQKDQETPVVLMGYLNPVEVICYESLLNMHMTVVSMVYFWSIYRLKKPKSLMKS